jgi:hypothetical protein
MPSRSLHLFAAVLYAACGSDDMPATNQSDPVKASAGMPAIAPKTSAEAASGRTGSPGMSVSGRGGSPSGTSVGTGGGGTAAKASTSATAAAAGTTGGSAGTVASAAAGSGGSASRSDGAAGTAGTAVGATADVACNPADKGAAATPVSGIGTGEKPGGMFATAVEIDPGLPGFTIFRPEPLGMIKHPVFTWGNGGCMKSNAGFSEFLLQIAAEGIVVIADGTPNATGSSNQDGSQLTKGIDWAEKENERPCSKYYHKLNMGAVGVSGQSCGGLMAINASSDKRVTTSMPMNSGLMSRNATLYAALHAPMAIINGGPNDIAYANGNDDFEAINNIPIMIANLPVGHGGTYREDNGGEMGKFARAWLRWQLLNDDGATGKGMFIGDSCGFCGSMWEMKWKMKPM